MVPRVVENFCTTEWTDQLRIH